MQRQQPLPHVLQIRPAAGGGGVVLPITTTQLVVVRRTPPAPCALPSHATPRESGIGLPRASTAAAAVPPRRKEHVGQKFSLFVTGGRVEEGVAAARTTAAAAAPHSHQQTIAQPPPAAKDALRFGHFCLEAGKVGIVVGDLAVKLLSESAGAGSGSGSGHHGGCCCQNPLGSRHHVDEVAVLHLVGAEGLRVCEDFSSVDEPLPRLVWFGFGCAKSFEFCVLARRADDPRRNEGYVGV